MVKKLVVFDLDGTLLNCAPGELNFSADEHYFIASARSFAETKAVAEKYGIRDFASDNGAIVRFAGQVIHLPSRDQNSAAIIAEFQKQHLEAKLSASVFDASGRITSARFSSLDVKKAEYELTPTYYFAAKKDGSALFTFVDKSDAVAYVAKQLNIANENVICFGDGKNDWEMLKRYPNSVLMYQGRGEFTGANKQALSVKRYFAAPLTLDVVSSSNSGSAYVFNDELMFDIGRSPKHPESIKYLCLSHNHPDHVQGYNKCKDKMPLVWQQTDGIPLSFDDKCQVLWQGEVQHDTKNYAYVVKYQEQLILYATDSGNLTFPVAYKWKNGVYYFYTLETCLKNQIKDLHYFDFYLVDCAYDATTETDERLKANHLSLQDASKVITFVDTNCGTDKLLWQKPQIYLLHSAGKKNTIDWDRVNFQEFHNVDVHRAVGWKDTLKATIKHR